MDRSTTVEFDPNDASFLQNPYLTYDRLRAESPVFFHAPTNLWYVTTYAEISAILRDRRFGRDVKRALPAERCPVIPPDYAPFSKLGTNSLFDKEPPEHTRLRALVQMAFTPRRVQQMRPRIEAITDELLNAVAPTGEMDLLANFAEPLPVAVIAEMLGIPVADRPRLRPWSNAIVAMYELNPTPAQARAAIQASVEFADYLRHLAAQRRANPQDDLMTGLALAEAEGERLSEDELVANCVLLLNAGHEATVNVLGNGVFALLQNPEQLNLLKGDPGLLKSAVEELMRYDTPLQLFRRWVQEDVELHGHRFQRGQEVGLIFGAANRDPARFVQPHSLDIRRVDNPHLSLSEGVHFCLGAPLARLELQVAIEALIRRFSHLRLVENEVRFKESWVIRGVERLLLQW